MSDQLKTVDEIMEMVEAYGDISRCMRTGGRELKVIRAAIVDLHTAAGEASDLRSRVAELEAALMPFAEEMFIDSRDAYDAARKAMGLEG